MSSSPIDFHIFQRGGPTTNQLWIMIIHDLPSQGPCPATWSSFMWSSLRVWFPLGRVRKSLQNVSWIYGWYQHICIFHHCSSFPIINQQRQYDNMGLFNYVFNPYWFHQSQSLSEAPPGSSCRNKDNSARWGSALDRRAGWGSPWLPLRSGQLSAWLRTKQLVNLKIILKGAAKQAVNCIQTISNQHLNENYTKLSYHSDPEAPLIFPVVL